MKLPWLCLLAACGSSDSGPRPTTFGDARPVDIKVPPAFDDSRDYPLIVGLGAGLHADDVEVADGSPQKVTIGPQAVACYRSRTMWYLGSVPHQPDVRSSDS